MTPEERERQKARIGPLFQRGMSRNAIARETHLARDTITTHLHQQGLVGPRGSASPLVGEAETARMIDLHVTEGRTPAEAARLLGRSLEAVGRRLRLLGVLRPRNPAPTETIPVAMAPNIARACALAANTLRRVAPPNIPEHDQDDWHSFVRLVALKALGTYDAGKGVHWQSWVISKVRWEIIEELRRTAPFTRAEWARMTEEGRAEVRWALSLERLRERSAAVSDLYEDKPSWEPTWAPEPTEWLMVCAVRDAVAALPARQRYVVQRAEQGYTYAEIGAVMGVSASRVSQINDLARERLRAALAEWA